MARPLAVLLFLAAPVVAAEAKSAATALERLEQVLIQAQDSKDKGAMPPDRYEAFLVQFRAELETALVAEPPSPKVTAAHARILARLGDTKQAFAVLEPAREENPKDDSLAVAASLANYQDADYPTAYAEAQAVLARDPGNEAARVLLLSSKGRVAGRPVEKTKLPSLGTDGVSPLQAPEIIDAGRRAVGRQNALKFVGLAHERQKIGDPREALRYLALAEGSDPALADVPMQQGIAHATLGQHKEAVERLTKAEALWLTGKDEYTAGLARKMRIAEESKLAQSPTNTPSAPKGSTPLPFVPIGLFTSGALTAYAVQRSRQAKSGEGLNPDPDVPADNESRNWFLSAAGAGAIFIGLAAWEFGPGALAAMRGASMAGGMTPALAGGGAVSGTAIVGTEGLVGVAAGMRAVGEGVSYARSDKSGESNSSEKTSPNYNTSDLPHIFRDAPGHVTDNPQNRSLFLDIAKDTGNFIGTNKYGTQCYLSKLPDGRQAWVFVRNGLIRNAGINNTPVSPEKILGL